MAFCDPGNDSEPEWVDWQEEQLELEAEEFMTQLRGEVERLGYRFCEEKYFFFNTDAQDGLYGREWERRCDDYAGWLEATGGGSGHAAAERLPSGPESKK